MSPATKNFVEPKTIAELEATGRANLALTKKGGMDYAKVTLASKHGITNKSDSFRSFEEEINQNFAIKATEATDRNSKRVGVLGYKVGCTHFWDKWGVLQGCTVIQLDRCQVTQVKTLEHDGVNSI
jgi:hypothetical protein